MTGARTDPDSLIRTADQISSRAHRHDKRVISGLPFIVHPRGVCRILKKLGYDHVTLATALLHDCPEDHPKEWPFHRIERQLRHVDAREVTKRIETVTYKEAVRWNNNYTQMANLRGRYCEHLLSAPEAAPVSFADLIDNTEDDLRHLKRGIPVYGRNYLGRDAMEEIRYIESFLTMARFFSLKDGRISILADRLREDLGLIRDALKVQGITDL